MVQVLQKRNISVSGINKPGFTLLELVVAVAIIALIVVAVVPRFDRGLPLRRRQAFTQELNALLGLGWQQALTLNRVHRVTFNFEKGDIALQVERDDGATSKKVFNDSDVPYVATAVALPTDYEIKNFYIEGHDEMQRSSSRKTKSAYFFIVPEGLVQSVVINAIDKSDLDEQGRAVRFGLVVNSFSGQCSYHDSFQKP